MAGMAWTLHPSLFYKKYGSVLVQLWDSGALRTVSRPFRRLSASLSAAVGSSVGGSRQVGAEVDEGSTSALLFPDGTPVSEDAALSMVDRDAVQSPDQPSTSQCNELAFQEDMYVILRRQRKQQEKLKGMREVRKDRTTSTKQRRSGFLLALKSGKKKGKHSRPMTAGTPMADLQGALPRKSVTLGIAESDSPALPVETEPESGVSSHTSSADRVSDDDDGARGFKSSPWKLQSARGMPGEQRSTEFREKTPMSQENEDESPSDPGLQYSVVAAEKEKKAQRGARRGVHHEDPPEPRHGVLVPSEVPNHDVLKSKKKGRKPAKKVTSPSVDASLQPLAHANSKDDISGPSDVSRSVRNIRKIVKNGRSPVVFPLEKEGQDAATQKWSESKRESRIHAQRSASSKVDLASTEIASGATAKDSNISVEVLMTKRKSGRNSKKRGSPENGGTSTKLEIDSEPRDHASSEASAPHRRSKVQNEMPTAESSEAGVDSIKPRLNEEYRKSSEELMHAYASNSKRKSRKGARNKSSPKVDVAYLEPGSDAALTDPLQMTLDNEAPKRKRIGHGNIKNPSPLKGAAAPMEHGHERGPKDSVQALTNVDTLKRKNEPDVDSNSLSWTEVGTASMKPTINVDSSDAPKWSSTTAVSKLKGRSQKNYKSPDSRKAIVAPMKSIPEADGDESARHISGNVKSKSKVIFRRDIENLGPLGPTVTSIDAASDAYPRRSLRLCTNTDASKRKVEAPEDTASTLPEVCATSMDHGVEAASTGLTPVSTNVGISERESGSQKSIRSPRLPDIDAASIEPRLDQGSRRQSQMTLDAETSTNKAEILRGGKDSNSVGNSVTSMGPGHEPVSRNSLHTLPDVNLSTRNGLGHKNTNISGSTLGPTRINLRADMDPRDSSQTSLISQASKHDERQEALSAYVLPGESGLYESSRDLSGTVSNFKKFQIDAKDKLFTDRVDEPGPSDGRFTRSSRDVTDVVPGTMPTPSLASVERCKASENPRACFILSCALAKPDVKPGSVGVNSRSAEGTSTNEERNDPYRSGNTQRTDTANILGTLRHPMLKRGNSDRAYPPREAQRSPHEQWPRWLAMDLDNHIGVPRLPVSTSPEEERLRQRLAAWDPFQEESYALTSPDQIDLPNKEQSDADLPLRPQYENKLKASLSMEDLCACSSCLPHTIRSKMLPLHTMTPDENLYEDMHWITEPTGGSLAASSEKQLPSALARPPDVSSATSGSEGHRALKSLPPQGPPQVRSKVAAADDIEETLPYTVQKSRRHNRSPTSLHALIGGWGSSSGSSMSRSFEASCTMSHEGAQLERERQLSSKAARSAVLAEWVHLPKTGATTGLSSSAVQGPRPADNVKEEASTRGGTDDAVNAPEAQEPLSRGKIKHTGARKKRLIKKTGKPKKREPPRDHRHRARENDAEDNSPPDDGNVGSVVTPASTGRMSHINRRMVAWHRSNDNELAFSDTDYVDLSSSGEVRVWISMTTRRQRSMIWPFESSSPRRYRTTS